MPQPINAIKSIQNEDISHLEDFLFNEGVYQIPSAKDLKKFSLNRLRLFGLKHGMYQLPTKELIDFLSLFIVEDRTIEIGGGSGVIGEALDIPCTDSRLQEKPEIKAYYDLFQQPTIKYGGNIVEMDANTAVKKYSPSVVIGSWITGQIDMAGNPLNMYGPDEMNILAEVDTYILVGNHSIHRTKDIMSIPHRKYTAPWIVSKAEFQEHNAIYVWSKNFSQIKLGPLNEIKMEIEEINVDGNYTLTQGFVK